MSNSKILTLFSLLLLLVITITISSCKKDSPDLFVPSDFEVTVVIDSIPGGARHIAVRDNGDIYVKLKRPNRGGNVALRDKDGDGRIDTMATFGNYPEQGNYGTAMRIYKGYLYFSTELNVYRMPLDPNSLVSTGPIDTIFKDDHAHGSHEHIGKPVTFDDSGHIFIPFGAPSNTCQEDNRIPFSKGMDPCPLLEDHGGIWRFDANKLNQRQKDGYKYATGLRSIVGMEWNSLDQKLYALQHGRDDLFRLWPDKFTSWQSALFPSEEFLRIDEGSHSGWPYCYYDQLAQKKVLCPEYGGDGKIVGRCDSFLNPVIGFPGHWAPNDIHFYRGDQFPDHYKNGAFIAFHGATNRAPYPQSGYFIGFVPYENGQLSKNYEVFADGFAQVDPIVNVSDAVYRPMGIAMGPDGSMYFADTEEGKIWRVKYKGDKSKFGTAQLAGMELRKQTSSIRDPHSINDDLDKGKKSVGQKEYNIYCGGCHQSDGMGASGRFPPLASDWVTGDKAKLINVVLKGVEGEITVNNEKWSGTMPKHDFLPDDKIATILSFIRKNWGNNADSVTVDEVKRMR